MVEADLHRDIGKHDAQIEGLQHEVQRLHKDMAEVIKQLRQVNDTLSQAKGGWKTLMMVAGMASAATAAMTKVAVWWTTR